MSIEDYRLWSFGCVCAMPSTPVCQNQASNSGLRGVSSAVSFTLKLLSLTDFSNPSGQTAPAPAE